MDIKYDMSADAVYLNVSGEKVAKTLEMADRLLVDLDKGGRIVGIEILEASHQTKLVENLQANVSAGVPINIVNSTPVTA